MVQPSFFGPNVRIVFSTAALCVATVLAPTFPASAQLTEQQKRDLPRYCSAAEIDSISRLQSDQAAHGIDLGAAMRVGMGLSGPCNNAWSPSRPPGQPDGPCTPEQEQRMIAHNGLVQAPNEPELDCHKF